jgi:DNA-binding beta-propeller fold protein YncE
MSHGGSVTSACMMKTPPLRRRVLLSMLSVGAILLLAGAAGRAAEAKAMEGRFLYVATPGVRDYLEYGGHGVLVFDIDHGHRFVKRIASSGVDDQGKPINVKGICASAATRRLYVSNIKSLVCFDLTTDQMLWEKFYEGGCDRMSISPDGKVIYLPSFEGDHWHVINALTGEVLARIVPKSGAHNTIVGPDGREAYLAGLKSPLLTVADMTSHTAVRTAGPFSNFIRPFTVNGRQTLVYVNVNGMLGFEIGDLKTGKMLHRVEVTDYESGGVKRHGCPSHGIALTLDEKELWLADAHNRRLHIFDNTVMPPKKIASVELRDEPGWITFGIDGRLVYPSTGEVVDARTRKIVATLKDENGMDVQSEKLVEIDFAGGRAVRAGDQFAIGGGR